MSYPTNIEFPKFPKPPDYVWEYLKWAEEHPQEAFLAFLLGPLFDSDDEEWEI